MSAVTDRLDEIEERAQSATKGPWGETAGFAPDGSQRNCVTSERDVELDICEVPRTPQGSKDSYFIAEARTDVPDLIGALRAVLAIHRPEREARPGFDPICLGCYEAGGSDGSEIYPCPTVRAVTAALAGEA